MTKIYIGTDHAGYELKEKIKVFLTDLGYEVDDKGPFAYDANDDYPDFITPVAQAVAEGESEDFEYSEKQSTKCFGIILGGSGQGEAMCANRVKGVRAGVYYGGAQKQTDISGNVLDMVASMREHNNANILSLGARFMTEDEVKEAIKIFIETPFSGDERHIRRINKF